MSALPVAHPWFRRDRIDDRLTRIVEPHVHEFLQGNSWWLAGRDRDLVVDAGLGVASMRAELPELFAREPVLVITHAHLDHMGSAHEFTERWAHAGEPVAAPLGRSLVGRRLAEELGLRLDRHGPVPELFLTARPHEEFDAEAHRLAAVEPSATLADGDVIDLGDRELVTLHLPGHTPGSLALFEPAAGALFSGDVVYDDVLLDDLHGSDRAAYAESLRRLLRLPIRTVYPGHGGPFGAARLREIVEAQLRAWGEVRGPS
ncbi:MBL fold metallo-hydrolase [Agromyces mediolanus]|uniref:MBL fold metallo-hydrolase n=1 Tax=Agromyces mediolanus TaxID=41986 RepID=UPI00203B3563|nr:MBL fold metallo-hydrolase [Agromyces mediolanus]MCM3658654.1 MBL fold metallo-hydrolase [Agromyces mediolanus]